MVLSHNGNPFTFRVIIFIFRFHVYSIYNRQEETRKSILDEVLELARDEESSVREAALETVLNMTQLLDDGR